MSTFNIRNVETSDAERIAEIYNYYILSKTCTFEEESVSTENMRERIILTKKNYPYLVLEHKGEVKAYAYATQWKVRSAYNQTCELSVYVDKDSQGSGYGQAIYTRLIQELKQTSYIRLIGGIAMPNPVSIRLHEKLGFAHSGTLKRVGIKFDKWIDVAYYQLEL